MHSYFLLPGNRTLLGASASKMHTGAVKAVFDSLRQALGGVYEFSFLFPVILTDRGVEFGKPQWDIRKCVNHINNAPRKRLGDRTPYEPAYRTYNPETLKVLQLRYIAPDDVVLSPKLLKK